MRKAESVVRRIESTWLGEWVDECNTESNTSVRVHWNNPWIKPLLVGWKDRCDLNAGRVSLECSDEEFIQALCDLGVLCISINQLNAVSDAINKGFSWLANHPLPGKCRSIVFPGDMTSVLNAAKYQEWGSAKKPNCGTIQAINHDLAEFSFKGLKLKVDFQSGAVEMLPNCYRQRADVTVGFADTYLSNLTLLQEPAKGRNFGIQIIWADDKAEVAKVIAHIGDHRVSEQADNDNAKDVIISLVTNLVSEVNEDNRRLDAWIKQQQKEREQRIESTIKTSRAYGNILGMDILRLIKRDTRNYHTESSVFADMKKIYPSLMREDVSDMLFVLDCNDVLISRREYWKYREYDRYIISDKELAEKFLNPSPLNYGKNNEFERYSDIDWIALLKGENPGNLSIGEWESRMPILEHTIMLESNMALAREYFSNAPEEIKTYILALSKMERSLLKKRILRALVEPNNKES